MLPRCALASLAIVLCAVSGCRESLPQVDMEAQFDREIETKWKTKWKWVDAVPHLERGGFYMDDSESKGLKYDRPHVLPLLNSLHDEFALQWKAVVHQKQRLMTLALVAELPADPSLRAKIDASLDKHQKTFPGAILVQWGHRWLSLDFLTPEQEAFLGETDDPPAP
jgi:hypothetical protein